MRILVVGAGAVGGYFGGRLLAAGRDVTFLVRQARGQQLDERGLQVRSPLGDITLTTVPWVRADGIQRPYDLVLVSCKAGHLPSVMDDLATAVGPGTLILPLLNGLRHLEALDQRFGAAHVLGGKCFVSLDKLDDGTIVHFNERDDLSFGVRAGQDSAQAQTVAQTLAGAGFTALLSPDIIQEMWEKWTFIATAGGITCLMRASVGDVVAAGGVDLICDLFEECSAIARGAGYPPREPAREAFLQVLTQPGSALTASMLRDVERGDATEADHVLGDLLDRRLPEDVETPDRSVLRLAYTHLLAYAARRRREQP
ncbi:ketopantoate reductase family protein [Pseudomonas eucalypticola]|uniref:2-dehydropantoate 2-reductase n=1 Tax=Pseudomonas eucalypticola TaxID=2599595 RepID=A0A7D5D7V2_9PSED|nr:ketopantoate reductase family protein [Pseudomonas eucalypticola]QKZ04315.1 ketopantoate reductase family protein [Pseudomonas eucalypticola]